MATQLLAFHGKQEIKDKYLARVRAHAAADEITKGIYWENGRGCAVGCSVHSSDHRRYEVELGIPSAIAHLEDGIFEALPLQKAKEFPEAFLSAITPGSDLALVSSHMMLDILDDPDQGLSQLPELHEDVGLAIAAVSECYRRRITGDEPSDDDWNHAGTLALAALAWDDWAVWNAWNARNAWDAQWQAAWAAWAVWNARNAWATEWQAERLLHHLANAPVPEEVEADLS